MGIADQALALIKAGDAIGAVKLIEHEHTPAHGSEAVQRVYAVALAQSQQTDRALAVVERLFSRGAVELATRALAARLYEDSERYDAAFEQYAHAVTAQPAQSAWWRGLWRSAARCQSSAIGVRALSLTVAAGFDASADVAIAWAVTQTMLKQPLNERIVAAALAIAQRTLANHPDDTSARWLYVKRAIDCEPADALRRISTAILSLDANAMADDIDCALALPHLYADDDAIEQWRNRHETALRTLAHNGASAQRVRATAFGLAYHGHNDLPLQMLRGNWLHQSMRAHAPQIADSRGARHALPRIGFVSKHIRDCTVGHYFKRFFTDLNQPHIKHFDIHIYACGTRDAFTDDIENAVDTFHHFDLQDDDNHRIDTLQRIANAIIGDQIDILIYPEIGMEPFIEKLAAMRLARLQCALWGHPVTTGLPTIDVFFSAASMEPSDAQTHYRERLQCLPGLGTSYPIPPPPASLTRAALGLPNDAPLAVCAQSSFKWTPDFIAAVIDILKRHRSAILVIFANRDPVAAYAFRRYLQYAFERDALNVSDRIVTLAESNRERFLATLAACDVSLDTFGFSGGNTTLDALSVSLPVVTLPGEYMRGRQTMAMLNLVDAPELIATTHDDYVSKVVHLLSDVTARNALQTRIQSNAHRLFNDPLPVAALRHFLLNASSATNLTESNGATPHGI
jgi:predicted O-linked N-acetylglucosamine transferase (SPINDLY family)